VTESCQLLPATDAAAAAWITGKQNPSAADTVAGLLPPGFAAYVRVLHPAWSAAGEPVSWRTVADWAGTTLHPLAQFRALSRPRPGFGRGPRPWEDEPRTGSLPPSAWRSLHAALAASTSTPNACWFGLWDGWNYATGQHIAYRVGDRTISVQRQAHMELPYREYALFSGPLAAYNDIGYLLPSGQFKPCPPSLVWPEDHEWMVAADVDLDSTYVGASKELLAALEASEVIEACVVRATDSVTATSDRLNAE
jgi:hypothetical protein